MSLFLKECKRIIKSLIFWLYVICLVVSWSVNFLGVTSEEISAADRPLTVHSDGSLPVLRKPMQGDKAFGIKKREIPDKLMTGAADQLLIEYKQNRYQYYPLNYVKFKTLGKEQQNRIKEILEEITGLSEEQLHNLPDNYFPQTNGLGIIHMSKNKTLNGNDGFNVSIKQENNQGDKNDKTKNFISQVSYEKFKERMLEVESMIGKNSMYSMSSLIDRFGVADQSYKEALEEYNTTIQKDKVTGAFARLFCDYMGLSVGLFPIFIVVFMVLKDRRAKMNELIYSRRTSSIKLIFCRYFAYVTVMIIPILLLSLESLIQLIFFGESHQIAIDYFGFLKYILWWLLPTIMIVTAVGMFLTLLTDAPIAIAVQLIWWFVDSGLTKLSGDYSLFNLMIRNNSLRGYDLIHNNLATIWTNRILLVSLAGILLLLSAWIYEKKRKGRFDFGSLYIKWQHTLQNKLHTQHT